MTDLKLRGTKVLIAIGGWNDSLGNKYSRLVNNPQSRKKFNDDVLAFIKKHNFDGLDLDWEYPKCWQVGGSYNLGLLVELSIWLRDGFYCFDLE